MSETERMFNFVTNINISRTPSHQEGTPLKNLDRISSFLSPLNFSPINVPMSRAIAKENAIIPRVSPIALIKFKLGVVFKYSFDIFNIPSPTSTTLSLLLILDSSNL
ncbi:106aa long hypothetical protein [Pyrococcus horikoshii OT3]|uniref:Uncharacterized protein n=1 Tax=Pyrococcus horikoshii (strain ATCC 700860 / DSM 12428 / JCM 9974 / NBRC 100139 / OT-3) TaxID=70601 RepID=O59481_PYRHO|nr:106aa long hypothetical protein [Pyrococcus horikoshii OT3]